MSGAMNEPASRSPAGVTTTSRRWPMWVIYGWAVLGAAYVVLIWKGEAWFPSWPAGWTDALDAVVGLLALTFGLLGFYRQGALRGWVLGLWAMALVGCGLYIGLR